MARLIPGMLAAVLCVSGCVMPLPSPQTLPGPVSLGQAGGGQIDGSVAARNFVSVVTRMEPVVEQECRQRSPRLNCDFLIVVDDRPDQPPNAFQTQDRSGRPVIAFTLGLIAEARNQDELAFIMGHEAAHHIMGHLERTRESALTGALILGTLASIGGGGDGAVTQAQQIGATVGARRYSQDFELEADQLGTEIAFDAGFDPGIGAQFFDRLPDPGNTFLGTHPPNSQRAQTVQQTLARLRGF